MNTAVQNAPVLNRPNPEIKKEHPKFFIDGKHDYFFIKNNELYDKLKNGKDRHRIHLEFRSEADQYRDNTHLTEAQVNEIERRFLK